MFKLPLFPLNTVLFPGTPISLHIFEERYKLMIGRCIEANQPFGVVLLKSGAEVQGFGTKAQSFMIGCTALVTQAHPAGRGRMNIVAIGQDRFRILALEYDQPYLVGAVEPYPFTLDNAEAIQCSGNLLLPWIERYLETLEQTEKAQFDVKQLPKDSLRLAYLGATILKLTPIEKQDLLSVPGALDFMSQVRGLYRKEVTLLKALTLQPQNEQDGPFSLN